MSADSSDIAASYDAWAATYDVDANPTRDLDAAVLRAAALTVAGCDVLEIGCGTGKNTAWLAERAKTVTALDVSTRMLEQARTRLQRPDVLFIEHDIRAEWPIGGSSIDLVVGNLVPRTRRTPHSGVRRNLPGSPPGWPRLLLRAASRTAAPRRTRAVR